jgi:isopenicillin-N epimerase
MSNLRSQFLLDPEVVFLTHGTFGACPKPVFETYQRWQLELERQPVLFLGRRVDDLVRDAMRVLAEYVHADAEDMIFVQNVTTGVNMVARSLPLQSDDEILTTDHEYGACMNTWAYVSERTGAKIIQRSIPLPVTTPDDFVEHFWAGVTPRTRVIYLSHVTSPTALIFPIAEILRRAREVGILTVIDGAHAPGHIPVDLKALDADFYTGNCHKWLCAPKGTGFLYVRREHQSLIQPLVISWMQGQAFQLMHHMQGTRDPAGFLSIPAAIAFQREHDWDVVRARCHELAVQTVQAICELTQLQPIAHDTWFGQMATIPLPPCDENEVKRRLYDEYRIELPVFTWKNRQYLRVSFQGYSTIEDAHCLKAALAEVLPLERS